MKILGVSLVNEETDISGGEDIGLCYIISNIVGEHEKRLVLYNKDNLDDIMYEYTPEIIITSVYYWFPCVSEETNNICIFEQFGKKVKENYPSTIIIVGGFPISYYAKETLLKYSFIDYVILFEGEDTINELIACLDRHTEIENVAGIAYRKNNDISINPRYTVVDLSRLCRPDRQLLLDNKLTVASISTSRGCIRSCSFCSVNDYWKKIRFRNIKDVIDEVEDLNRHHGFSRFNFVDASYEDGVFQQNRNRMVEIADEIINRHLDITYYVQMRAETVIDIDADIGHLVDSGLGGISVGIETFNETDRELYNKYASVDVNILCVQKLLKLDIPFGFNLINFNPYSSWESLVCNAEVLHELGFMYDLKKINTFCQLYRNSRIFIKACNDGLFLNSEDLHPFDYQYVNKDVGEFGKAVFKVLKNKMTDKLHYYGHEYQFFLIYLKRKIRNDKLLDEISCYQNEIASILGGVNDYFYRWYMVCLNKKSAELLHNSFGNLVNDNSMINTLKRLENIEKAIIKKVIRYDKTILKIY